MIKPAIEIIFAGNIPWNKVNILFHTIYDLPDSVQMNGWNFLSIDDMIKQYIITIQKIKSKRDSTRNMPCNLFERETCQNFENNKLVLERFNCQIPILYYGQHLDKVRVKRVGLMLPKMSLSILTCTLYALCL